MDDLTLVQTALQQAAHKDIAGVADGSGVPESTVIKIKYGTTKDPGYQTVKKLADYFRSLPKRRKAVA